MKKQKFELSHDIIAEKVWARLPEQDKQLRMIQASIRQRQEDYAAGKGSLLGKAELEGWAVFLPGMELSGAEEEYVTASKKKEKADRRRRLYGLLGILALILVAGSVSGWLISEAKEAKKDAGIAQKEAVVERAKADSVIDSLKNVQQKLDSSENKLVEKTITAESAVARADSMEKEAKQAQALALLAEGDAKEAIKLAERKQTQADSAFHAAQLAISDQKVAEAAVAFQNRQTQRAFRLVQKALERNPENENAKYWQAHFLNFLGIIQMKNVLGYKISPDYRHLARLVQQGDSVFCQVFILKRNSSYKRVLISKALEKSYEFHKNARDNYLDSYRFSDGGGHIAFLIQQDQAVKCQIFALKGDSIYKQVITSKALEKSFSYSDSYCFSGGEGHIAFLIQQDQAVKCEVFALHGDSIYKKVLISKDLKKSINSLSEDSYHYSYKDSYSFSEGGQHIAFLIQQDRAVKCEVFTLDGDSSCKPVVISEALEKSDGYSYYNSYNFSGGGRHVAFLIQQNQAIRCQIFALEGDSIYKQVLISKELEGSGKFRYLDSYRFSEVSGYIAFLIQQDQTVKCEVFALEGDSSYKRVVISKPLEKSNSVRYIDSYRFSGGREYIAFLIQQGKAAKCEVYALHGDSIYKKIITSKALGKSSDFAATNYNYEASYRFSEEGHVAFLIQQDQGVKCEVFALQKNSSDKQPINSTNLGKSDKYSDNYRFVEGGSHVAFLTPKEKKMILTTYSLDSKKERKLEGIASIETDYAFIPETDLLVYRTTDNHLKVVDISIPQDSLISYYDKVLPTLEELEKLEE